VDREPERTPSTPVFFTADRPTITKKDSIAIITLFVALQDYHNHAVPYHRHPSRRLCCRLQPQHACLRSSGEYIRKDLFFVDRDIRRFANSHDDLFVSFQAAMQTSTARHIIMSDEETQAVMNSAQECIDSECSIDETTDLLKTLKSTEKDLEERLETIMNMIAHLQHINQKEERKTDEVREFVKDMMRVFNTDVSDDSVLLQIYGRKVLSHDFSLFLFSMSETHCFPSWIFGRGHQAFGCLQLTSPEAMEANSLNPSVVSATCCCRHILFAHTQHTRKA
jgi:hypothetical protein